MRPVIILGLLIAAGPALAKECRMPDVPPGIPVHLPPECRHLDRREAKSSVHSDMRGGDGFVDLGHGTKVRVGGRVRAETGLRR
ncbi:hypothetical protein ACFOYU_22485 [Microvirga sp. GCM10011540]|uniref:hypothetical protein n=1 Tax=Microvirga sp. GCM10011540 TaxID=3317338 RepID=UPI00362276C3